MFYCNFYTKGRCFVICSPCNNDTQKYNGRQLIMVQLTNVTCILQTHTSKWKKATICAMKNTILIHNK